VKKVIVFFSKQLASKDFDIMKTFEFEGETFVTPLMYMGEEYHNYAVCKDDSYIVRIDKLHTHGSVKAALTPHYNKSSGYPQTCLSANGIHKTVQYHVAVADTLIGRPVRPPSVSDSDWKRTPKSVKMAYKLLSNQYLVNHIDHNKKNFSYDNLEYTTAQGNAKAYQNTLDVSDLEKEIKKLYDKGYRQCDVIRELGITRSSAHWYFKKLRRAEVNTQ
jgi:hypothetical protein